MLKKNFQLEGEIIYQLYFKVITGFLVRLLVIFQLFIFVQNVYSAI